ncbi:hypothetical protein P43SY_004556 [Pythium insidiosum]|uniref:HTH psq-type domain-containing protein n=1 Tax=Pythium insidiosum TaxID=114742 RepID=A0AAD5MGA9_PYTIN|nr:hypothetical protein P43SY_004556 [Pythium insidiosum]
MFNAPASIGTRPSSSTAEQSASEPERAIVSGFAMAEVRRTRTKNSRYLREIDRRNILERIQRGEKQAALAKEFQVSRAAICNLNKHRDEVLSRKSENPLAKHPKKPRTKPPVPKARISSKTSELTNNNAMVYEVKSRAMTLILSTLRDRQTRSQDFERLTKRLLPLVISTTSIDQIHAEYPFLKVVTPIVVRSTLTRSSTTPQTPSGVVRADPFIERLLAGSGSAAGSPSPPPNSSHDDSADDVAPMAGDEDETSSE